MPSENAIDMILDGPALIPFLSGCSDVEAGTVILTGSPSGVGAAHKAPVPLQSRHRVATRSRRSGCSCSR
uniref:Fumarylacetoacetase-like C-terminal domain-containing protein n=1 Tax=Schlesneria paludicola TaxID=360056 RepID=A0A7C2NYA8_9PLAN